MNGKGDTPRPVNKELYDKNYEKIFKKKDKEVQRSSEEEGTSHPVEH